MRHIHTLGKYIGFLYMTVVLSKLFARAAKQNSSHGAVVSCSGVISILELIVWMIFSFFVDIVLIGSLCICPFIVAVEIAKCSFTAFSVKPGMPIN